MSKRLVIAIITTDDRDERRQYSAPAPFFGTAPTALLQGLADLPDCEVHVIACVQKPVESPEKLAGNIFYHSILVGKWGWMRGAYAGCVMAVRKKLREIKPDIVHGQGTERYCAVSAAFSGFPNVVTIHGKMTEIHRLFGKKFGGFHWLAGLIEEFSLPRTHGIICISEYVKNLATKYRVPMWIVPNAIQKMFFDFPRTSSPPAEIPLLINVGVISERKRQVQVLEVFEFLRREGLKFEAIFVGQCDDAMDYPVQFRAKLEQASAMHGGFKHIKTLDQKAFCELYDSASAMVHFSSEESFGLTFAEAIARGLYLFASDVGAARDIANTSKNTQVFELNDWEGMKDALRRWLVSGGAKQPHAASPSREFIQRYHPGEVALRHLEIYREVLRATETSATNTNPGVQSS